MNDFEKLKTKELDNLIINNLKTPKNSYKLFIKNLLENENIVLSSWYKNPYEVLSAYPNLFKNADFISNKALNTIHTNIFWGSQFCVKDNISLLNDCMINHNKYVFAEMGFLHRIAFPSKNCKFSQGCSFMFDDIAPYYDARFPNRLEQLLNDKTLIITNKQKQRAKNCINKIIENYLTKYNHQPIFTPNIGRKNVEKVLVVDQVYGDMSITKGLANDNTFKYMLDSAIKENPNADIIVKTHPDTINGMGGYYTKLQAHDNLYLQTEPINPISLANYVDKVYVCTTQLGFEALLLGKEVHTFGMPFYANWGLTKDRQKCNRRNNERTLEELFYIAYIIYTYYINPKTNKVCEIEEAIEYLLKLRNEYFLFNLK